MKNKRYYMKNIRILEGEEFSIPKNQLYKMLFTVRGKGAFSLQGETVTCGQEGILLVKPDVKVEMNYEKCKYPLEVIVLSVTRDLFKELSDENTDLENAFHVVPFEMKVVHCESNSIMLIKNIAKKLLMLPNDTNDFAHDIYEKNLLSMLMVLVLRACIDEDQLNKEKNRNHVAMDDIFLYIKTHLTEDISLSVLEKEFFISRYHIIREFKNLTGLTPHAYIIKSRLDLCRKYIEQGKSIREVYQLGGFGGYNHFFRAFKKEYGITPMEYYRSLEISKK